MSTETPADQPLRAAEATEFGVLQIPNSGDGVEAIAKLAVEATKASLTALPNVARNYGLPADIPIIVDPAHAGFKSARALLEEWRTVPERRKGTASAFTLASFIALVNRQKSAASVIFASSTSAAPALQAVINYHPAEPGQLTGWCDHRVRYEFPLTKEVKVWRDMNAKSMSQGDFVLFLEEHAAELASPTQDERKTFEDLFREKCAEPNELIALARGLEIHVNSKVKQVSRPASGERILEFSEEHVNGKGEQVEIPGLFMVSVAAFVDGEPIRVPARLRYRVAGGIAWSYHLYRLEEALRERVQSDLAIAAEQTGLMAFEGSPESI